MIKESKKPTRRKVLDYIQLYEQRHGFSPTVREIGAAVGLKSTSSVYGHLQRLKHDGLISTKERRSRTISTDRKIAAARESQIIRSENSAYIQCSFSVPQGAKVITVVATMLDKSGKPILIQANDIAIAVGCE